MTRIHMDTVLGAVTTLLALAGVWYALSLGEGPRVFPLLVLTPALVIGPLIMVRGQRKLARGDAPAFFASRLRFFQLLTMMVLFILGVQYLGFFTTTVVMVPLTAWTLGYRNLKVIVITTAVFLAFIYGLFIQIFSRPLPPEIWTKVWF